MIAQFSREDADSRTIVVALGGNALQPARERGDIAQQFAHTRESLEPVVALAAEGWRIVVVHGNGPQIGDGLLRNELARDTIPPLPLGVLGAATAGWIGYMIQQSLQNALAHAGVIREVVTVITQVVVDPDSPSTFEPVKPIGRTMDREEAEAFAAGRDVTVAEVGGRWRRVVPSPTPLEIVECGQVHRLVQGGTIVVAAGGGGTPVYRNESGALEGIDGVVDKDRAAMVLGRGIDASILLILTDVDGVYRNFGTESAELLRRIDSGEAERLVRAGQFDRGGMAPKVEAAVDFVRSGGQTAFIARLDQGLAAVRGGAGTSIVE